MVVRQILLFILLIPFGCGQPSANVSSNNRNDAKQHNTNDSLKHNLIGKWGSPGEKPIFEIRKDSIYYYNRDSSYPYRLKGDTLGVKFPDRDTITEFGKVKVIKDTLMIYEYANNNFLIRGYRFKD